MNRLLLLIVFFVALSLSVEAQTSTPSCAQTLRLAQSIYEQGRLHEIPPILQKCFDENGFSQQEKISAYKILTNTYIYLEEPEKADETMLKLLQTDHYFEINEAVDPAEFVALYKTFRTTPVYRIGLKLGSNASQPNVISFNPVNEGESSYLNRFGFNANLSGELPLPFFKGLTLNPELGIMLRSFGYSGKIPDYSEVTAGEIIGKESQLWLSLPVSVQYEISKSRIKPYLALGVSVDYLLNSKITAEMKRPGNQSIEQKSFDVNPLREKINLSIIASTGVKLKVKGGFITAEARIYYGLSKISNSSTLLENQFLISDYNYADGIFKINSLSLTVGYAYNIFNPIKLKK